MKLLAFDTSGEACSVALYDGQNTALSHRIAPREQARLLLPEIQSLMSAAQWDFKQLDAIAFGRGPGSFTGLRICAAVCQGLALAHELPVISVSSLQALAFSIARKSGHRNIIAAFDARLQEVYLGAYQCDENSAEAVIADCLGAPDTVALPEQAQWYGAGSAFGAYRQHFSERLGANLAGSDVDAVVHADALIRLAADAWLSGETLRAEQAIPAYLREQVAQPPERLKKKAGPARPA